MHAVPGPAWTAHTASPTVAGGASKRMAPVTGQQLADADTTAGAAGPEHMRTPEPLVRVHRVHNRRRKLPVTCTVLAGGAGLWSWGRMAATQRWRRDCRGTSASLDCCSGSSCSEARRPFMDV